MNDAAQDMELTELQSIEFNRRMNVADAVIPAAQRLLYEKHNLAINIETEIRRKVSYWTWASLVIGLGLHFFLATSLWTFNVGTAIFLFAGYLANVINTQSAQYITSMRLRDMQCDDQLSQLEVIWSGATALNSLKSIREFASEAGTYPDNEEFIKWRHKHTEQMLVQICGYEKGERIAKDRAERLAKFDEGMRSLRASRGQ